MLLSSPWKSAVKWSREIAMSVQERWYHHLRREQRGAVVHKAASHKINYFLFIETHSYFTIPEVPWGSYGKGVLTSSIVTELRAFLHSVILCMSFNVCKVMVWWQEGCTISLLLSTAEMLTLIFLRSPKWRPPYAVEPINVRDDGLNIIVLIT